jgi:hypothetical protein
MDESDKGEEMNLME